VLSVAYGSAREGEEPQLDGDNGPRTITGPSGCSRAAFRGRMELKQTPDRQPVNPREAKPARSASNSSDSEYREKQTQEARE